MNGIIENYFQVLTTHAAFVISHNPIHNILFSAWKCVFFLQCNIPISLFVDLIMFMSYNKWMIRVFRIFHLESVSYAIMIAIG